MPLRFLVVLAAVAALLGAPSLASAAGNSLGTPSVSPASGTVATVFTLRVTYDGKFPATGVTASVAGVPLRMIRIGGDAELGTWSVSTLLPAGTWTPTFTASTERGNSPSAIGPAIVVAGPQASATPPASGVGPSPRNGEIDSGGGGAPGPGTPAEPGTAPAEVETEPEPSAAADPMASASTGTSLGGDDDKTPVPAGPPTPASSAGDDGGTHGGAAPAADAPTASRSAEPGLAPLAGDAPDPEPTTLLADDGIVNAVLLIGLSGVAAVAIIGTAVLILGRRRAPEEEAAAPGRERSDTDALLERRTLRQAKVRLEDDPIVAAMGVDDQVAARRRRTRASQVGSGPGERSSGGRS